MKTWLWSVVVSSSIVGLSGCGSTLAPEQLTVSVNATSTQGTLPDFAASVTDNAVTVTGGLTAPTACYLFTASVDGRESTIEATVTGMGNPAAICVAVLGKFTYTLTVGNIPKGTWTLRVKHRVDQSPSTTAFETTVHIR